MKFKDLPPDLLWLTSTMVIANISTWMYLLFLPLYLANLGASVQEVGFFATVNIVISIFFRILGGWISDNIGRLRAVALGSLAGLIGMYGLIFVPSWQWVIAIALVRQVGVSLVAPSFRAFTAEQAADGEMSRTFGLVQSLFLICRIVGPILGGILIDQFGFRVMFAVASVIFTVATVIRFWLSGREKVEPKPLDFDNLKRDLKGLSVIFSFSGILLWLFVTDGLFDASNQIMRTFTPIFLEDQMGISETSFGILVGFMSLVGALAMVPGGSFADRFGERWSIAAGVIMFGCAWGSLILLRDNLFLIVVASLSGIAMAFIEPAFASLISKAVPSNALGMMWGVFMTAFGFLAIPAPYIAGWFYDVISPDSTMALIMVLSFIIAPLAIWKLQAPRLRITKQLHQQHQQAVSGSD